MVRGAGAALAAHGRRRLEFGATLTAAGWSFGSRSEKAGAQPAVLFPGTGCRDRGSLKSSL